MKKIALVVLWLAASRGAAGVTISLRNGYDALELPIGARTGAMGETGLALGVGPLALHSNPALLALMKEGRISATHAQWFQEGNHNGLTYARPYQRGVAAISFQMVDYGTFEARDVAGGLVAGRHSAEDYLLKGGYAEEISPFVKVGAAGAVSIGRPGGTAAVSSLSLDSGVLFTPWIEQGRDGGLKPLKFALTLKELGQPRQGGRLPTTFSLGAAYDWPQARKSGRSGEAAIEADARFGLTGWLRAGIGGEYWLLDFAALRAGFRWNSQGEPYDYFSGFSAGLAVAFGHFTFDYAFAPYGELGNTHRFTLEFPL